MMGSAKIDSVDWANRIGRHIVPNGVVVPPRIAAFLEKEADVTGNRRMAMRDSDPLAYEVLAALHLAALHHRSGSGTKLVEPHRRTQELDAWVTTSAAAEQLGVSDRAVRKWIAAQKLPAMRHGGRWLINRIHLRALAHSA
jgi:excisionase family DNA binding protein